MSDAPTPAIPSIGDEGRKILRRRRRPDYVPGMIDLSKPASVEHYHVIYHVQPEGPSIPDYRTRFVKQKHVYLEMQRLGRASEPNTEWYDDGRVMIETRLHGRIGLHRVVLEAARCVRSACIPATSPLLVLA